MSKPWIVAREGNRVRWGGDLRRRFLLEALALHTGAAPTDDWTLKALRTVLPPAKPRRRRPRLASCEFFDPATLRFVLENARPTLLDIHDDPVAQFDVMHLELAPERRRELNELKESNVSSFKLYSAPSETFVTLTGLPPERTVVAWNGTNTSVVVPSPWPVDPVVGMTSGAAPERGIETLIEAMRIVRKTIPDARLCLWLTATGPESKTYLDSLVASIVEEEWIAVDSVKYADLGATIGTAKVLCVPSPPNPYMDSATPVKLADSLAAGRPVVVTPRVEARRIVERFEVGTVSEGDEPEQLAAAIESLLLDDMLAQQLGDRARAVAVQELDWDVIGQRLVRWLRRKLWWF